MESLSRDALCAYLVSQGLDADLANKLYDEKVDGKKFVRITADILRSGGFTIGDISDILEIREKPYEKPTNILSLTSDQGSNESEDSDAEGYDDRLSPYLNETELNDISPYEKKAMARQLARYERALTYEASSAVLCKPAFVKKWEEKEKKKQRNAIKSSTANVSQRQSDRLSSKVCSNTPAGGSSCATEKRIPSSGVFRPRVPLMTIPSNSQSTLSGPTADLGNQEISQSCAQGHEENSSLSRDTSKENQQINLNQSRPSTSIQVRPSVSIQVMPSTSGQSRSSILQQSSNEDSGSDDSDDQAEPHSSEDFASPPFDLTLNREMTPDQVRVSSLQPTLPNYNIFQICNDIFEKSNDKVKTIILKLKNGPSITTLERKRLMRAFALHLYNVISSPLEVTPAMKEGLAKSFVIAFPEFMVSTNDGRKPWGLIYNRNGTGFLANASRAPRRKFEVKRKKTSQNVNLPVMGEDEYDSDYVKELALTLPDRSNKTDILNAMFNTFKLRKADRLRRLTITDMIIKYPHFTSYSGEVLREEFKRMEPKAKDGSREFLKLLPQILQLNEIRTISLSCEDDVLKALVLISQHLPHDVVRRGKGSSFAQIESIASIVQVGDDIDAHVAEKASEGKPVQPYLILVKALIGKKIVRTFLVLDRQTVQLTNSSLNALDALFKSYFVFNVQFPTGWGNSFHFLATCFYNVFEKNRKRPDCIAPNEHELFVKLGGTF